MVPLVNTDEIRTLYAYNRWANRRLLRAAQLLPWSDFIRDLRSSHGSVRGTLVHIIWGEWLWIQRWRGESPKQIYAPEGFHDWVTLDSRWTTVENEQQAFLESLNDELLNIRVSYENLQGQRMGVLSGSYAAARHKSFFLPPRSSGSALETAWADSSRHGLSGFSGRIMSSRSKSLLTPLNCACGKFSSNCFLSELYSARLRSLSRVNKK